MHMLRCHLCLLTTVLGPAPFNVLINTVGFQFMVLQLVSICSTCVLFLFSLFFCLLLQQDVYKDPILLPVVSLLLTAAILVGIFIKYTFIHIVPLGM